MKTDRFQGIKNVSSSISTNLSSDSKCTDSAGRDPFRGIGNEPQGSKLGSLKPAKLTRKNSSSRFSSSRSEVESIESNISKNSPVPTSLKVLEMEGRSNSRARTSQGINLEEKQPTTDRTMTNKSQKQKVSTSKNFETSVSSQISTQSAIKSSCNSSVNVKNMKGKGDVAVRNSLLEEKEAAASITTKEKKKSRKNIDGRKTTKKPTTASHSSMERAQANHVTVSIGKLGTSAGSSNLSKPSKTGMSANSNKKATRSDKHKSAGATLTLKLDRNEVINSARKLKISTSPRKLPQKMLVNDDDDGDFDSIDPGTVVMTHGMGDSHSKYFHSGSMTARGQKEKIKEFRRTKEFRTTGQRSDPNINDTKVRRFEEVINESSQAMLRMAGSPGRLSDVRGWNETVSKYPSTFSKHSSAGEIGTGYGSGRTTNLRAKKKKIHPNTSQESGSQDGISLRGLPIIQTSRTILATPEGDSMAVLATEGNGRPLSRTRSPLATFIVKDSSRGGSFASPSVPQRTYEKGRVQMLSPRQRMTMSGVGSDIDVQSPQDSEIDEGVSVRPKHLKKMVTGASHALSDKEGDNSDIVQQFLGALSSQEGIDLKNSLHRQIIKNLLSEIDKHETQTDEDEPAITRAGSASSLLSGGSSHRKGVPLLNKNLKKLFFHESESSDLDDIPRDSSSGGRRRSTKTCSTKSRRSSAGTYEVGSSNNGYRKSVSSDEDSQQGQTRETYKRLLKNLQTLGIQKSSREGGFENAEALHQLMEEVNSLSGIREDSKEASLLMCHPSKESARSNNSGKDHLNQRKVLRLAQRSVKKYPGRNDGDKAIHVRDFSERTVSPQPYRNGARISEEVKDGFLTDRPKIITGEGSQPDKTLNYWESFNYADVDEKMSTNENFGAKKVHQSGASPAIDRMPTYEGTRMLVQDDNAADNIDERSQKAATKTKNPKRSISPDLNMQIDLDALRSRRDQQPQVSASTGRKLDATKAKAPSEPKKTAFNRYKTLRKSRDQEGSATRDNHQKLPNTKIKLKSPTATNQETITTTATTSDTKQRQSASATSLRRGEFTFNFSSHSNPTTTDATIKDQLSTEPTTIETIKETTHEEPSPSSFTLRAAQKLISSKVDTLRKTVKTPDFNGSRPVFRREAIEKALARQNGDRGGDAFSPRSAALMKHRRELYSIGNRIAEVETCKEEGEEKVPKHSQMSNSKGSVGNSSSRMGLQSSLNTSYKTASFGQAQGSMGSSKSSFIRSGSSFAFELSKDDTTIASHEFESAFNSINHGC